MFNSKSIREDIAAKLGRIKAISATMDGEDLDDEQKGKLKDEANALLAEIGNSGADGEAKTGLYSDLATAERIDAIESDMSADANTPPATRRESSPAATSVRIRRSTKRLKAYNRNDAESVQDAYRAGRWLAAAVFNHTGSAKWCGEHGMDIQAAQTEGSNSKGGFLVPEEFSRSIIDLREEYGVFRRWARVIPMASDHMVIPRRLSGPTAYAVGEANSITASEKSWNRVELTAKKWGALTKYSSELAEDAFIDLADDLADEFAYAFANKEDESGFNGTGGSSYNGVSGLLVKVSDGNHAGSIYTAASGNTAFSTLDLADFEGALGKVPQYAAMRRPAWFISRTGYYASMARLKNAAGGNNNDDLGAGSGMEFLGLPVVISQVLNSTTGAQGDTNICAVGDLSLAATLGDRRQFEVAMSEHADFASDQVNVRGTSRIAINVHDIGDATSAGPMVVLRTPSS